MASRALNPVLVAFLSSPLHLLLSRKLLVLKYNGRRTGQRVVLPVTYVQDGEWRLILVAGHSERKAWWHNFDGPPQPVVVRVRGRKMQGTAQVLEFGCVDRLDAMCVYIEEFKNMKVAEGDPIVAVTLSEPLPMLK